MPTPGEHKTVQSRILAYAEASDWNVVPRAQAEQRRGFAPTSSPAESATGSSLYFFDQLDAKVLDFNSRYTESPAARPTASKHHPRSPGLNHVHPLFT
jgi:type I restriction enzyme R subunit